MTRYQPAEILISAGPRFHRDIQLFSASKVNFVLEASAMCADGLYQHRHNESINIIANEGDKSKIKGSKNADTNFTNIQVTG